MPQSALIASLRLALAAKQATVDALLEGFRPADCAGHHPPILAKRGREPVVLPSHGFALGVEVEMPDLIREHQFVYETGMLFVLYTDGLIEINHDIEQGQTSLLIAARNAVESPAPNPARFIVESVVTEEQTHPDDIAVPTIAFA